MRQVFCFPCGGDLHEPGAMWVVFAATNGSEATATSGGGLKGDARFVVAGSGV